MLVRKVFIFHARWTTNGITNVLKISHGLDQEVQKRDSGWEQIFGSLLRHARTSSCWGKLILTGRILSDVSHILHYCRDSGHRYSMP